MATFGDRVLPKTRNFQFHQTGDGREKTEKHGHLSGLLSLKLKKHAMNFYAVGANKDAEVDAVAERQTCLAPPCVFAVVTVRMKAKWRIVVMTVYFGSA